MIVKSGLGSPAQMHGGCHMGLAPLHDPGQLLPVIDLLKLHQLHRCAGDDHSVEMFLLDLRECHIKLI